jgi:DNA mismatch repair protein MutS
LALNVKALTLFATHYFELTTLADELPGCINVHLDAVEHNDSLVFLHKVKPGTVNRSYGLQVATLAGVPRQVVNRAKDKLQQLELEQHNQDGHSVKSSTKKTVKEESELEKTLAQCQPDELSPREALDLIYQLKKLL